MTAAGQLQMPADMQETHMLYSCEEQPNILQKNTLCILCKRLVPELPLLRWSRQTSGGVMIQQALSPDSNLTQCGHGAGGLLDCWQAGAFAPSAHSACHGSNDVSLCTFVHVASLDITVLNYQCLVHCLLSLVSVEETKWSASVSCRACSEQHWTPRLQRPICRVQRARTN